MRREALHVLACPSCGVDLALAAATREEGDHVIEGEIACLGRGCRFPITRGVPYLMTHIEPLKEKTAARFADEWTRWSNLHSYYERQFLGWVAPLAASDFAGKLVFEGGCGKGRHTDIVARFGARMALAVDLGESAHVAFENTRHLPNAHIVRADLLTPPVKPVFDLAFSVGVLHHLPHPEQGFQALTRVVRDGGRVAAWVYGAENNEWITRFVDPVRKAITAKLEPQLLRTLSTVPTALLFAAIKLVYRPKGGEGGRRWLPYAKYFTSMYDFPFEELHSIVFDQLVTPVAHYLPGDTVRAWLRGDRFRDAQVRWHNDMSWTATALVDVPHPPLATTGAAI